MIGNTKGCERSHWTVLVLPGQRKYVCLSALQLTLSTLSSTSTSSSSSRSRRPAPRCRSTLSRDCTEIGRWGHLRKNAGEWWSSNTSKHFQPSNLQHCDWMMRVSEDQHNGCSHEHLYIVVINFNQQSLKQTKDTCWRNWRVGPATRWSSISISTSTKFSSTSTSMPTSKWKLPFSYPSPLPNHSKKQLAANQCYWSTIF